MIQINTILVPTDFSPDASAALERAVEFAKAFDARIHLLHAYQLAVPGTPWEFTYPAGLIDDIKTHAENSLGEVRQKIEASGVKATSEAVVGPASLAITEAAKNLPADLIVMGTRGLTGIKHVVLGSVAERTLRHAPCPVLTVKADQ